MIPIKELNNRARQIRKDIILSLYEAGSGHLGGSLGLADIFTALYFHILNHQPDQPNNPNRDRLILSIGHVAPALYCTLAHAGYFNIEELSTLRKLGSRLQGHPGKSHGLPGIETSSGSLGQGLSIAVGLALSAKYDNKSHKIYCIMGDGELQEGSIWEAAMSANHYKLNNLIGIIDRNYCQIDGNTENVMQLEPLNKKWESFGWKVIECDGNNIEQFIKACKTETNQPLIIIAKTKMGKGITSIENNYLWHGKVPSKKETLQFLQELY